MLARYDKNNDGKLDLKEWQQVRDAALDEVKHRQTQQAHQPADHVLTQPRHKDFPFIIDSTEQEHLSRRLRRQSIVYAVGFLLAGVLSCWLINSRFF